MALKNNVLREYPQKPNFDDQINTQEPILADVFIFGKQFEYATLFDRSDVVATNEHEFQFENDQVLIDDQGSVELNDATSKGDMVIWPHDQLEILTVALPKENTIISGSNHAAIKITGDNLAIITPSKTDGKTTYQLSIVKTDQETYFNNRLVDDLETTFEIGDRLIINGISIERRPKQLKITPIKGSYELDEAILPIEEFEPEYPVDFPNFQRSPRIMLYEPKTKINVNRPESLRSSTKSDLMRTILPPLGMLTATLAMTVVSGRNPAMMLTMGSASVITIGLSISSYFKNRKDDAKNKVQRIEDYHEYMIEKASEIKKASDEQRRFLDYHYPDMNSLASLISNYSSRIYEKTTNNLDFLSFSLGKGNVDPTFEVQFNYDEQQRKDPLVKTMNEKVVKPKEKLTDAQIVTTLAGQTIGFAGLYPNLKTAVQTLLLQIATFHSYHDVQMIFLVPEESYQTDWQAWRWLPHVQIEALNLRGIVHNSQTRDMILNSFYQLLNKRRQLVRERNSEKEKIEFSPHYILTILDDDWLAGHSLNEFLAEDMSQYGVTVIWGKEDTSMLPETVTTLVDYDNQGYAELINEKNDYVATYFQPYKLPTNHTLEQLISRLANLNHLEVEKNSIPESVTFLEMYGVNNVESLNIPQRWEKADTAKSLAVPLGLRGKDDLVYLNLHERAHGPHGLVAGTTGSGKSETVQSYLLSLAVNFAPEDVGFLPIDFKGGGMANLFNHLPHLLGAITNLDGAGSARALASIRAELQKRQRLFGQYGVNHINGYTKLYKTGKTITDPVEKAKYPDKPLPHLFLFSDEFAELKANEPDFMAELVSTARIGRSLGVHLILATQKPSGVVDDQIWSNSRFKIALKVQDVADSNEILKTPDAASIVEPGRAYLQVGNNEIYELFQSAWSGAKYHPNQKKQVKVDERMWVINDYGQPELLTSDLSEDDETAAIIDTEDDETQLDAVIDEIAEYSQASNQVLPDKPWLPPLKEQIPTPEIDANQAWQEARDLSVPIGFMDIPTKQKQEPLMFDLEDMKHTAIFASPGFGKSTLLQTLVMNLAKQNTPMQVQFNLLDFGTNGLLPLQDLPHVADLVRLNEQEKLQKMMRRMSQTIDERKAAFQQAGVVNLVQFEQDQHPLPIIVNVIDSYDAVIEDKHREEIDNVINKVLREGAAVGVYLIITANRSNSLRMSMMSNIETKMALFLVDDSELGDIIGREKIIQQEIVGRGQIKQDETDAFQVYLPNQETEPLASITEINAEVDQLNDAWTGERPTKIPIVPEEFTLDYFMKEIKGNLEQGILSFGLALTDTTPVKFNVAKSHYFMMAYSLEDQLVLQQRMLFAQLQTEKFKDNERIIVDFEKDVKDSVTFSQRIEKDDQVDGLKQMLATYVKAAQAEEKLNTTYLYIADLESFIDHSNFREEDLKLVLEKGYQSGLVVMIQSMDNYISKSFDPVVKMVRDNLQSGIISAKITDTNLIPELGSAYEPNLKNNEGYFFESHGKKYVKIRIPGAKD